MEKPRPIIAPSILSADFSRLAEQVRTVEQAGATWLHIDVMDGHFVPNLTVGPLVVKALRPITKLKLDCHLMVSDPEKWIEVFARAGADAISVHAEATAHLDRLLHKIKESGCMRGVAINPATPLSQIEEVLDLVDFVLIMSVNPGFGGQKFIKSSLSKVRRLAKIARAMQSFAPSGAPSGARSSARFGPLMIEVDGGVNGDNIAELREAGVDIFVAGSSVFDTGNPRKALRDLMSKLGKTKNVRTERGA